MRLGGQENKGVGMIYGKIGELRRYIDAEFYGHIEKFLYKVSAEMADGEYPILGERVFARVMSYQTVPAEQCKIEAHNRYIDIQVTITGAEGISVYDRGKLVESVPYKEEIDTVFFQEAADAVAHTVNLPECFTMLFPGEAHRPQERVYGVGWVKKYVIKVATEDIG